MLLWWDVVIDISHAVKAKTNTIINIYWRDSYLLNFFASLLASYWFTGWTLDPYLSILRAPPLSKFLMVIRWTRRNFNMCLRPRICFVCSQKSIGVYSSWGHLKYYWSMLNVVLKKSPISFISPICSQLNRLENGNTDSSSEAHLKVQKPVKVPI